MQVSKKRIYKAIDVKDLSVETLLEWVEGQKVCVGLDVAKENFVFVLMNQERQVLCTLKFQHPEQTPLFIGLLRQLPGTPPDVAMEPTGTYGDALRALLWQEGFTVYRVNPKSVSDSAEIYDNVPSLHDAKAAAIIADLHLSGRSHPWPLKDECSRQLEALLRRMELYDVPCHRHLNQLEAQLARHWPELPKLLSSDSATLLDLLSHYGSPACVQAQADEARQRMSRVGGAFLSSETIEAVLASAQMTLGVPMIEEERATLQAIARETRRLQQEAHAVKKTIEQVSQSQPTIQRMGEVVGKVTAAVLVSELGDPGQYKSADSYLKGCGLNLKIRSSGQEKGHLKITKRGSGTARRYLCLAVWRWLQKEPVVQAWYERKVARDGGTKMKATVALMRKLAKGLWHVAQGALFDVQKLFATA